MNQILISQDGLKGAGTTHNPRPIVAQFHHGIYGCGMLRHFLPYFIHINWQQTGSLCTLIT